MARTITIRLTVIAMLVCMWLCCMVPAMAFAAEDETAANEVTAEAVEETTENNEAANDNAAENDDADVAGDNQVTKDAEPSAAEPTEGAVEEDTDSASEETVVEAAEPVAEEAVEPETNVADEPVAEPEIAVAAEKADATNSTTQAEKATTATAAATVATQAVKTTTAKKTAAKTSPSGPIPDGTYVLNFAKSQKLMVSVAGGSKKSVKLQMKNDNNKKCQKWIFTWVEKYGAYLIQNANSKLYVTTKSKKAGKDLVWQMAKKKNSKLQMWVLKKSGKGYKILSAANKNIGFGTWSGKLKADYFVTVQSDASKKQKFYILPVTESLKKPSETTLNTYEDGKIFILTNHSKWSLDIVPQGSDVASKIPVTLAKVANKHMSSKWSLKATANGSYQLVNLASNKALAIDGKHRYNDTPIIQATRNASSQLQQWWIYENSDGSHSLVNRFNGLTLRATGDKLNNGVALTTGVKPAAKSKNYAMSNVEPIDEGVYEIAMGSKISQAFNIPGKSAAADTQVKTLAYNKLISQKFKFAAAEGVYYTIRSQYSSRYLADKNGKIVQGTYNEGTAQRWEVVYDGDGFLIKNVKTGNYMRISGGKTTDNAAVVSSATYNKASENLRLIQRNTIDDGTYFIWTGSDNQKVLGSDKNNSNKSKAKQYVYAKADNQAMKYTLTYLGKDSQGREVYKLINCYSNKALSSKGTNVYQYKYRGKANQKWALDVSRKGGVMFVNTKTGKALKSKGKNKTAVAAGANVKSKGERWDITETYAFSGLQLEAYKKIAATYSNTNYAIAINLSDHYLWVFQRTNSTAPWTLKYEWRCSNGKAATPTPAVNMLLSGAKRYKNPTYNPDNELYHSAFYYMTYIAKGKYIHTPLYQRGSKTVWRDKRMCKSISNGCVRVLTPNAIWVYKNIKRGTRCITYY
ncbi:MAG: RICIN domain-containing protein [Coriobacteriia bacterium]|nr:RICIN domain-containing protein [Coriobacteriia bacterium]